jgi:hypothetical protein
MPIYFMLHDAGLFESLIRPALAASWRQRSFAPWAELRKALTGDFVGYYVENHVPGVESILLRSGSELSFDKVTWRYLVGEVLLIAAAEAPEIAVPEDTFCWILHRSAGEVVPRSKFGYLEQALYGARDLVFGGGCYRPDHGGYNDEADVESLSKELKAFQPAHWTIADLAGLCDSDEERRDELEFARACLQQVQGMYTHARAHGQIVICERL